MEFPRRLFCSRGSFGHPIIPSCSQLLAFEAPMDGRRRSAMLLDTAARDHRWQLDHWL